MKKKLLALLVSATVVCSFVACGSDAPASTDVPSQESSAQAESEATPEAQVEVKEASIDFEDGSFGFVGLSMAKGNADASELSLVDYNGSKALKVDVQSKVPYVALSLDGLLGADIEKVRTIEMDLGVDLSGGKFYACSGRIYAYSGTKLTESYDDWAVYMEKSNPKTAISTLGSDEELFVANAGNYIVISKETDNAQSAGNDPVSLYIDNIRFLDASGNVLKVDTSAVYVDASSGKDMSNLANVTGAVDFAGFSCTGDAWGQNGFDMPEEVIAALVPGSVVEIEYASETGEVWIVMPDADAGWSRVANDGASYKNNSKNVAQITYEQIAAICGDDVSTWGARMQVEADSAWEVFCVRVGQKAPILAVGNAVDFAGFTCAGDAWGQNGFDMSEEVIAALVPGSVVELEFSSESGVLWIVMPDADAGWSRVGNDGAAICVDGKAYITYEQIAEVCGNDVSTWGARMQAEADTAWEVYAVKVGTASEMKMVGSIVDFEGFSCAGDAWGQNGFDMPEAIIDALVPGSVVTINYGSETGNMWIVMPDADAGWSRVGNDGASVCSGGICQITYEQIAEICGSDKSTWGARMQGESDSAWEVYSVGVGMSAE